MEKPKRYVPPVPRGKPATERSLSDDLVWEARRRHNGGESLSSLAVVFEVSRPTMRAALRGTGAYEGI